MKQSLAIAVLLATPALAQTATVTVSHNDPDGIVEPGQTIRLSMHLTWTPNMQLAGFAGQFRIDPATTGADGTITNRLSAFWPGALVNLGLIQRDDIVGIQVASIPHFFTPMVTPPWANWGGLDAFSHDWIAPATPGQYNIAFLADPVAPNVRLYPATVSANFVEAQTTYIGASITVTPSPASLITLAAASLIHSRRRRAQSEPNP